MVCGRRDSVANLSAVCVFINGIALDLFFFFFFFFSFVNEEEDATTRLLHRILNPAKRLSFLFLLRLLDRERFDQNKSSRIYTQGDSRAKGFYFLLLSDSFVKFKHSSLILGKEGKKMCNITIYQQRLCVLYCTCGGCMMVCCCSDLEKQPSENI